MEHRYSMYGVSVSSDIPFDFPAHEDRVEAIADVRFVRGELGAFDGIQGRESTDGWFVFRELPDGSIYLRWSGWYECRVSADGATVRYRPLGGADESILQNFLFGQALSFALVRQHLEPLHASVVAIDGQGVALLGDCTYGKSTLAASLLRAGCHLVSDDLLLVRDGARPVAPAGTGRIKLYPDSARAFLNDSGNGVRVIPDADKRVYRLPPAVTTRVDVPLRAFVSLPTPPEREMTDHVELQPLGRSELFRELVKNTFVRHVDDGPRLQRNFAVNACLAASVPGYRLCYPSGIERLPAVAQALLTQFAGSSHGAKQ